MTKYRVTVADNYHYMDESEWYDAGVFATAEEAIEEAKRIVDGCIEYEPGATGFGLFEAYKMFGDDPFIVAFEEDGKPSGVVVAFSAWDYAKQRCEELAARASREHPAPGAETES